VPTHIRPAPGVCPNVLPPGAPGSTDQRTYTGRERARVLFLIAVWIAWAAFVRGSVAGWWLAVPAAAFIALWCFMSESSAIGTGRRGAVLRASLAASKMLGSSGEAGDASRSAYAYAEDFDLLARAGPVRIALHAHAAARTHCAWLLQPAATEVVLERQAAVSRLRTKMDIAKIWRARRGRASQAHPDKLIAWPKRRRAHLGARESWLRCCLWRCWVGSIGMGGRGHLTPRLSPCWRSNRSP